MQYDAKQQQIEQEQIKLCAARYVYKRRSDLIWHKVDGIRRNISWVEWWEIKFGDDYYKYIQRQKRERKKK